LTSVFCRFEKGKKDLVVLILEYDRYRHVEQKGLRCLRAIDNVRQHSRTFIELDNRYGVRLRSHIGSRPVVDDVGVQDAPAAGGENLDVAASAFRAERTRWKIDLNTRRAALQSKFT
jgi:hypothetical protein